jgi:hypothetical protein
MTKSEKIDELLQKSLKTRTDVSIIVLDINPNDLIELFNKLEQEIRHRRVLEIAQGEHMLSIICDDPLALRLSKEYKKVLVSYEKNLSALTVSLPKIAVETPGILVHILKKFADSNINIFEIVSCYSDVSFILGRKDAIKAREVLGTL